MIKKYDVGGPWNDIFGDEDNNSSDYIRLTNPNAKLSKASGIKLNNLWNNVNIKLKDSNGGMSGFIDKHPYLRDTVHGAVSGATMLLNSQSQRQAKKAQRDYVNDPFNLYATSSMKKYGSRPWLDSTGQFTDFPNEKVPVFEPGYQNSAYTNPMATAKNGGQMYMAFQGGGATNQMGAGSSLPKYEMGAGSPIQQALLRDSQHYGLPMAKNGGFFTPEKLTSGAENQELYNKSNNFLNYLRDMSANTVVQNSLGRKRKGQLTEQEEMGMAQMGMQAPQQGAPQQGGQQEQLMQMVAQALQQGASPEEIMQKLVEMGIPEEQAMQVVQMVAEQLQGGGEEEAQQQMPPEMQQQMMQQMQQQAPQQMQQQMPMAQMGMGGGGGDFEEFGFDTQNPLNPYYQNLYDPSEAKQVNASLVEGLYNSGKDLFSQPTAYFKGKQADAQAQLDALQKYTTPKAKNGGMPRFQITGITAPTATDAAGFEKWYNETLTGLLKDRKYDAQGNITSGTSEADLKQFMTQAKQWAYDAKLDPNQLQSSAGSYARDAKYQPGIEKIMKDYEAAIELAQGRGQYAADGYSIDPAILDPLTTKRDQDIDALSRQYPGGAGDYFYSVPGNPPGTASGTTTNTTTTGTGGYQFNPAMQELLGAMAQGYSKAPLFGFRTNRNINALFNQTMADMMLKGQGQGQGTASATGAGVPGAAAMGPNGAANTWFKDNNINRYDIKQGPNRFKMKIRANQNGEGIVQYDANGKLINTGNGGPGDPSKSKNFDPFRTRNFDPYPRGTTGTPDPEYTRLTSQINPSIGYEPKTFFEKARNRSAENRLERIGSKVDRAYQKERYLEDLNNQTDLGRGSLDNREEKARNRRETRYNSLATDFGRGEYVPPEEMPQQRYGGTYAYGGAYAGGGQYKEGGTYYLSDEEIQALINAGYELE